MTTRISTTSYLAGTCSACAGGVQDHGLFWEMTSGCFPYPAPVGSTLDSCYVSLRRLFGFRLQKTVESPQLQFFMVVDISCRVAEADSHGLAVQQTIVLPLLQFSDKMIDVPAMQVVQGSFFLTVTCTVFGVRLRSARC